METLDFDVRLNPATWLGNQLNALESLQGDVEKAVSNATALMQDERFSDTHRQEQARAVLDQARQAVTAKADHILAQVDAQVSLARQIAAQVDVPSDSELRALAYARDYLAGQWAGQNGADIIRGFEAALANGDPATIRTYAVYGHSALRGENEGETHVLSKQFTALRQKADTQLASGDRKAALTLLGLFDAENPIEGTWGTRLKIGRSKAVYKLENAQISREGVIDGMTATMRRMARLNG